MKNPKDRQNNFKTDAAHQRLIDMRSAELGLSVSEYLRKCEEFAGEFFIQRPVLMKGSRSDFVKLASNTCNILVKYLVKVMML